MNPFIKYYDRYQENLASLSGSLDSETIVSLIENDPAKLNNLFMAGMGMSTLFLRMGAVIQMSRKLHDGDSSNDALFMKQVMDNLRETLPSDTNWKNLWYASMQEGSKWQQGIPLGKDKITILDRFVTFRNKFVHQYIRIIPEHVQEISKGLKIIHSMSELYRLFEGGSLIQTDGKFFWHEGHDELELDPFVQSGDQEGLPYLFQGLYENKAKAKFINTLFGDETKPVSNAPLEDKFLPMQQALRGGAGQVFDHSERMQYYRECFVGREFEVDAVVNWVTGESLKNVLPIYSEAGMGKGALTAACIDKLVEMQIPVMYHFCGSGMANSLHAVLYHFIMQGKKMPGMNGAGIWKVEDEILQRKMERLPSRYFDAIKLFQTLITDCYQPPAKYADKPMVIVIDGLDEAAVANSQLKISDWFYTYNDKDEPEEDWMSPKNVRWIYTYRALPRGNKSGFQLGGRFSLEEIPLIQPLLGLTESSVRVALQTFGVSEEFIQAVMEKGAVS
jgi:hypothetical protein